MRNLLESFLDQRETLGNLLGPFLGGQPQQFQQPNPNMLMQAAEAAQAQQAQAQQAASPLPAPIDIPQRQVAEPPQAVDPMQTGAMQQPMPQSLPQPQAMQQQPPQSKSGGFFDGLSKFGESDFGQRLTDMFNGWGMGSTMQDSLSKGTQMIAAGNQGRKDKKAQFSTIEWLKNKGVDETEAKYLAGNPQALNAYLVAMRKGVDPNAYQERAAAASQYGIDPNSVEGRAFVLTGKLASAEGGGKPEYGLAPQYGVDESGNPVIMQLGKDGSAIKTPLPDGVSLSKEPIRIDAGTYTVLLDPVTRQQVGMIPKNNAQAAAETVDGKAQGEALASYKSMSSKLPGLEIVVDELGKLSDKATYTTAGKLLDWGRKELTMEPREAALARTEYISKVDNQVLPMLRDTFGAAFTVKEGETLRATLGDPDKSPAEKRAVLSSFIEQKKRDIEALGVQSGSMPQPVTPVNIGGYSIKKVQ